MSQILRKHCLKIAFNPTMPSYIILLFFRDRIELFIDENKALMKRMYGEFNMVPEYGPGEGGSGRGKKRKRAAGKPGVPDLHLDPGPDPGGSFFAKLRNPRQSFRNNQSSESGR